MIRDQGAGVQQENQGQQGGYGQQANQANNNNMVKNAEVWYHIVRFNPSEPENINLEELNALKYTMGEGENWMNQFEYFFIYILSIGWLHRCRNIEWIH
jgi:hypothetical protein